MTAPRWIPARARSRRALLGVGAGFLLAGACAAVETHVIGYNERSHFDQIRAFDHGTVSIDAYRHNTGDRALYHGHYYSDKAPGMGFLLVPVYRVATATGVVARNGIGSVHVMVIFGCVLPLLIMLLLAYRLVERNDRGHGAVVAIILGLGTILLPFGTMLFSHVLSACLGFAAFYLLGLPGRDRERDGLGLILAAGALAGYAVSTEYPLAILALVLALDLAWRRAPVRALLAYGAGVVMGLIPLLLYDWWAFGAPLHLSYSYVAANSSGFLGVGGPSLRAAVRLLVSDRGLFVVTPVVAAALAGMFVLYREGRHRDAMVPAVVAAAYFGYNTCYYLPFGGSVPGPRFLITMLPFLAVPLAAAYRRAPLATLSLAAVSAATMIAATVTLPILSTGASTRTWWRMLEAGKFDTKGVTIDLFVAFVALAIAAAVAAAPRPRITRLDLKLTVVALTTWFAIRRAGPALLAHDIAARDAWGLATVIVLLVALAAVAVHVARGDRLALVAGLPLAALAARAFDQTTVALCSAAISLVLGIALARPRRALL